MSIEKILSINESGWDKVAQKFYGGIALPKYGPLSITEDEIHLLDDLSGASVLEIGCGSGHTIHYLSESKGAKELWGIDISSEQIRLATEYLDIQSISAKIFRTDMETNPGIPLEHFHCVVAIYSLGWTTDLAKTLELIYSYLRPGGSFVFSWEHPVYRCLHYNGELKQFVFDRSYQQEGPETHPSWMGVEIVQNPRKMSTYINGLINAGFAIENLIESPVDKITILEKDLSPEKWYSVPKAEMVPTTFIVKARKAMTPNLATTADAKKRRG